LPKTINLTIGRHYFPPDPQNASIHHGDRLLLLIYNVSEKFEVFPINRRAGAVNGKNFHSVASLLGICKGIIQAKGLSQLTKVCLIHLYDKTR
jgi:hypothetical protein